MSESNFVAGEEITLGGEVYLLPPLPLIKMSHLPKVLSGGNMQEEEYINALIKCIHGSLLRNYPDMKQLEVENNLDVLNLETILNAFMKVNKFTVSKEGGKPGKGKGGKR